nr:reverse transcriptase domain-containing protein [Tanacetum cinerariifolium]
MVGPVPITPLNEGTLNQKTTKSIIEGHVSALKELLKEPSNRGLIKLMLLDFDDIQDISHEETEVNTKGKEKVGDEDLSKRFKEVFKCPFTRRIVEFSSPSHRMPANAKIYDGTGDQEDHVGRFNGIGNQREWPMPVWCRMFQQTLDDKAKEWLVTKTQRKSQKIIRRANETLPNFKERWVSESNVIPNVPELIQISSFVSSHKCPESAKRFSDSIPKMVDGMLKRVDDYLRSEKRSDRNQCFPYGNQRFPYGNQRRRSEHKPAFRTQERHTPYVPPLRPNQEFHRPRENRAILTFYSLSSTPQEILATEHQLNLPQPAPLVGVPSKENLNKYCDYHNKKGHNTNDSFLLKRQLEMALESKKSSHLVKDVRQRGRGEGEHNGRPQKAKIINMVQCHLLDRKRKTTITDEKWINVPITFPSVLARDLSEEALVVEVEVEGYLVQRIHIDEGASIEIMFEH